MNDSPSPIDLFVELSSVLTGIPQQSLAPSVDPFDVKTEYYDYANKQDGPNLARLLQIYSQIRGQSPQQIANAVFNQSGPAICFLARSIMLEWLLGSWYAPADLQKWSNPSVPGPIPSVVISANAYTQGWTWKLAQSKPMGDSNETFGYWNSAPPSLADFLNSGN